MFCNIENYIILNQLDFDTKIMYKEIVIKQVVLILGKI